MRKQKTPKLVTIKVTEAAATNFRIAAAHSGLPQYMVSEEGSNWVAGKYLSKTKIKTKDNG